MRTYELKKYPKALAYKLHRNWGHDGTIKRCQKIYTQGKIKIFLPEFSTWHQYLKMIPCKKIFTGLFINHGNIWIPHTTLAAKLQTSELKIFKKLCELNKNANNTEHIGLLFDTYCNRLPKSRQKALWLNVDDLDVIDTIGLFHGDTWNQWQILIDTVRQAQVYYKSHPWTQTKLGLNLMANINFTSNASRILAIEAAYLQKMPFKKLENIQLEYNQDNDTFINNNVTYMGPISLELAQAHIQNHYPKCILNLFNGLAG